MIVVINNCTCKIPPLLCWIPSRDSIFMFIQNTMLLLRFAGYVPWIWTSWAPRWITQPSPSLPFFFYDILCTMLWCIHLGVSTTQPLRLPLLPSYFMKKKCIFISLPIIRSHPSHQGLTCRFFLRCEIGLHVKRERERADFSNLLQSLNVFLFWEVESFNFFLIAIQGRMGENVHKTLSMSFVSSYW